jgi:hypothetical protein
MFGTICRSALPLACGLAVTTVTTLCHAHFLWVKTITQEGRPHAFLFFGENALDEAYHLPESLSDAAVWRRDPQGKREELSVKPWEGEDRIGLGAPLTGGSPCVLEAQEQYGVYGTALLVYSAKHVHAKTAEELNASGASKELKLDIVPRVKDEQLELTVLWEGKPLPKAKVSVAVGEAEPQEMTTDEQGRVDVKPEGSGVVGVLANRMNEGVKGKVSDKAFDHELYYASFTCEWPLEAGVNVKTSAAAKPQAAAVPALPEPVSSFGAAVAEGWLYVYGGHTGREHAHSAANLSRHFRRLRLKGGQEWEELPMQTPLQGLALVEHGGKIYRVGGLSARNATIDEAEDLHSTAEFAGFDPATGNWTQLAPLPQPRSSHNAVVIGERLYVVGGWHLAGESPGTWQPAALVYDFARPQAGWQELPEPPFQRRALAVSHWKGKVVALGGMDAESEVSQRVDFFDPETGTWSQGPSLPGDGMAGFGISACNLDGKLYVSGLRGVVLRLSESGSEWEEAAPMAQGRFFHQLLPGGEEALLAIAGASRNGHLADIERIQRDRLREPGRTASNEPPMGF